MAGVELKVQILWKSMTTFSHWLDSCDKLLAHMPEELPRCNASQLRETALKYKDLLLQMKEKCAYMHEVSSLCKEVTTQSSGAAKTDPKLTDMSREVKELSKRFSKTCMQAKQQYSSFSNALSAAIQERESLRSFKLYSRLGGSFSETGSLSSMNTSISEDALSVEGSPLPGRRENHSNWSSPCNGGSERAQSDSPDTGREQGRAKSSVSKLQESPPQRQPERGDFVATNDTNGHPATHFTAQEAHIPGAEGVKPHHGVFTTTEAPRSANGDKLSPSGRSPSMRQKVLVERTQRNGSVEQLDSDKWETSSIHSTHSFHSLQNRIIYATDISSLHSMDSFDLLNASTSTETGFQEQWQEEGVDTSATSDGYYRNKLDESTREGDSFADGPSFDQREMVESRSVDDLLENSRPLRADVSATLQGLSVQLQDVVHTIAEKQRCGLQSLALELQLGEIKAMLTLLEVRELELVKMRATFSPSAQRKLIEVGERRRGGWEGGEYDPQEVSVNREEVLKLSERVELLHRHCSETITQMEEVLEFVMQYEGEVKTLRDFLSDTKMAVREAKGREGAGRNDSWTQLREALTAVNDHKGQLASIEQISVLLLTLEPIFDGEPIKKDMQLLSSEYQGLILDIFGLLEAQARGRTEHLLLEVSVMSSWVTETELLVQILEKRSRKPNGMSTKIAATREALIRELEKRKSTLLSISQQLQPITAVLPPDDHQSLRDLLLQVEKNTQCLVQIEKSLKAMQVNLRSDVGVLELSGVRLSADLKTSGQDSVDATHSTSPPGMYERLADEPPSPLVEYDQVPSRVLDSAIQQLPKQQFTPERKRGRYVTIDFPVDSSLYDHPRATSNTSLHEELLHFISQEWATLKIVPPTTPDNNTLLKSICCLDDPAHRVSCQHFVKSVGGLEENVRGVLEKISQLRSPREPDLERVHSAIDQCQKLRLQLERLHPQVEGYNEQSLVLLGNLPRGHTSNVLSQQLELKLFDVSTMWHNANLQVESKLRELREREGNVNALHRRLQMVSHALEEARGLLGEKQTLLDVGDYLKRCREMQWRLSNLSDQRGEVAVEIKDCVLLNPQSSLCQSLLDQLREVDTQWVSVVKELANMPVLEPVLTKEMFKNISKEFVAMEFTLRELESRGLNLEETRKKCLKCQTCLEKAQQLHASLKAANACLQTMKPNNKELESEKTKEQNGHSHNNNSAQQAAEEDSSDTGSEATLTGSRSSLPQIGNDSTLDRNQVHDRDLGSVNSAQEGRESLRRQQLLPSSQQNRAKSSKERAYVEVFITTLGTELASTSDCSHLNQHCQTLMEQANKVISQLESSAAVLESDRALLVQFQRELGELQLWAKDTKAVLWNEGHQKEAGAPSLSQHRSKYQAICQQVVARQPKMESLQSLAREVLLLPASGEEKRSTEKKLSTLYCNWDEICQQCIPAGVLPLLGLPSSSVPSNSYQAPTEFEDVSQMMEWLILIESKLQPEKISVGDFTHIKRILRDIQIIETELRSKEGDYRGFMNGSWTPSPEPLPSPIDIDGAKCVTFYDEDTLERLRRRQEIQEETTSGTGMEFLESETQNEPLRGGAGDSNSWRAGMDWGHHAFLGLQSYDSRSSVGSSLMVSPPSALPDELYQLSLLWNGIWATLNQQQQRLETIQDIWRGFESRKEAFCNFLSKAEERLGSFFSTLSSARDLSAMQAEMTAQKNFLEEFPTYEQRLSTLNALTHDLITHHHSSDDTQDLQDTMADLNSRWKTLKASFVQHHPTLTALCSNWAEFYSQYQSFNQWLRSMDIEMSNLNPFLSDMAAVRIQLEKQKEIQQELNSREGSLEGIRLLAYRLLHGIGGGHINASAIQGRLDNLARRWDSLQKLAQERKSSLEQSLSEKQDLLTRLADCLAWLSRAERHLSSQGPLGEDFYQVHDQFQAHQGFWQEVQEQRPKIEAVIAAGRQVAMETHWPPGTPERVAMDNLRVQYVGMEKRWRRVWGEGEEWGKLLEAVYPEMQRFQVLCTECGQRLSEAEIRAAKFDPIGTRMNLLNQQLESLQQFESVLVALGDILEAVVSSQKSQLQLQVRVSPDLIQLVKRFHQRWNELKRTITMRHDAIVRALARYDPATLGMGTLPRGWHRANTENGNPYYINGNAGNKAQWQHPELAELYDQLEASYDRKFYPAPTYPIALKLRAIQKKTQLNLLQTRLTMEMFEERQCFQAQDTDSLLTSPDMTMLALELFEKADEESPVAESRVRVNKAIELTNCWMRDIYDVSHNGSVSCLCFQIAAICMSHGKLEEKYRSLFKLISNDQDSLDLNQLTGLLEKVIQIPQSICQTQYCSLGTVDASAGDCFKKYVGVGKLHLNQFIAWLQTEPKPLAWLPVLHRIAASETIQHDVKCSVCKAYPVVGFRYRCLQCSGFDMCQNCYWSGKTAKGHDRSKHFMEEYCVARNSGEEVKEFFRSLQRSFRRKKKNLQHQEAPPTEPTPIPTPSSSFNRRLSRGSPPARQRHTTRCSVSIGDHPRHSEMEGHPARRFTTSGELPSPPHLRPPSGLESSRVPPPVPPKPARSRKHAGDLDASLTRLSSDNKNLSERLKGLREHRESFSPQSPSHPPSSPTHFSQKEKGERSPSPEQMMKYRNSFLQGRVQLLQEHNQRLESCIGQLKVLANAQRQQMESGGLTPQSLQNGGPPSTRTLPTTS